MGRSTHALPFVKKLVIVLMVSYIAFSPRTAVVLLIEYFKLDPTIALRIVQCSLPILVGIVAARIISIFLYRVPFDFLILLTLLGKPLWRLLSHPADVLFSWLVAHSLVKPDRLGKRLLSLTTWLEQQVKKNEQRKILLLNRIIAVVLVAFFFWGGVFRQLDQPWSLMESPV